VLHVECLEIVQYRGKERRGASAQARHETVGARPGSGNVIRRQWTITSARCWHVGARKIAADIYAMSFKGKRMPIYRGSGIGGRYLRD
jgi:hypothetical protein